MRIRDIAVLTMLIPVASVWAAEEVHSITPALAAVCVPVNGPIALDGVLDDAVWEQAYAFSGFTFSTGSELTPNATRVAIVRDAEALYLGVTCLEENMAGLMATETTRDSSVWHDDVIEVFLDTRHDHANYRQFAVNSVPALFDAKSGANTWDGEWEAASAKGDDWWGLEIRIPFATLGSAPQVGDVWGMNVCRERQAGGTRNELHNWADVQGNFLRPWLFGHVYFADADFEMTDATAREMFAGIGVPTKVFLRSGYTLIGRKGVAGSFDYREILGQRMAGGDDLIKQHAELAASYRAHEDLAHRDEFEAIDRAFKSLRRDAQGEGALDPVQWSLQMSRLDTLGERMVDLSWKVKLALLIMGA
jgi:hypothetical protein